VTKTPLTLPLRGGEGRVRGLWILFIGAYLSFGAWGLLITIPLLLFSHRHGVWSPEHPP
jgi:hypothetical protein